MAGPVWQLSAKRGAAVASQPETQHMPERKRSGRAEPCLALRQPVTDAAMPLCPRVLVDDGAAPVSDKEMLPMTAVSAAGKHLDGLYFGCAERLAVAQSKTVIPNLRWRSAPVREARQDREGRGGAAGGGRNRCAGCGGGRGRGGGRAGAQGHPRVLARRAAHARGHRQRGAQRAGPCWACVVLDGRRFLIAQRMAVGKVSPRRRHNSGWAYLKHGVCPDLARRRRCRLLVTR